MTASGALAGCENHADRVTSQFQSQRPRVSRTLPTACPPLGAGRDALSDSRSAFQSLLHSLGSPPPVQWPPCSAQWLQAGAGPSGTLAPHRLPSWDPSSDAAPWRMRASAGLRSRSLASLRYLR
jgi:hypothetical protein